MQSYHDLGRKLIIPFSLIADEMGRSDLVDTVLNYLKAMYAFWVRLSA
jgi:hypothetical protein